MIQDNPDVMKVCLNGGQPMSADFEAQGRTVQLADWVVVCDYDGVAPLGEQVDVEMRLAPGVVFFGDGYISEVEFHHEPQGLARVLGAGPIRPTRRSRA